MYGERYREPRRPDDGAERPAGRLCCRRAATSDKDSQLNAPDNFGIDQRRVVSCTGYSRTPAESCIVYAPHVLAVTHTAITDLLYTV